MSLQFRCAFLERRNVLFHLLDKSQQYFVKLLGHDLSPLSLKALFSATAG